MGFTKLDRGILQSSILAEDPETFKVWIVFLAACDPDGISRVSPVFVSSIARLPMKKVAAAIRRLSNPDPSSRSAVEKGRRIRRVDEGFFLINYQKYRAFSYSRTPGAIRTRRWREKARRHGDVSDVTVTSHSASASSSENKNTQEDKTKKGEGVTARDVEGMKVEVFDRWNEFAHRKGIPWIEKIEPGSARDVNLEAQIKEGFDIGKVIEAIDAQPFLLGDNKEGWLIFFDWFIDSPANLQKILEGNYTKSRRGEAARRAPDDPMIGSNRGKR